MEGLRTGVFVLFVLVVAVSGAEAFSTEPLTCYILDGLLIIYCIVATALYLREKVSLSKQQDKGGIYQQPERPEDADLYQVPEPTKRKKKAVKKKKPQSTRTEEEDKDPYESLAPSSSDPPQSPHCSYAWPPLSKQS